MTRMKKLKTFIKKRRETQSLLLKNHEQITHSSPGENIHILDRLKDFHYHKMNLQELYKLFQTDPKNGLTDQQAANKLKIFGRNAIPQKPQTHWAIQFLNQVSDPYSLWMWILVVCNFILFGYVPNDLNSLMLAWILIVTLISGGIISYCFNKQTANLMKNFQQFIPKYSTVLRSGNWRTVMGQKIVQGDIVKILPGQKIPADVRIIECHGMRLNKSTFTGQANLVKMTVQCTNEDNPLQSNNMAFSGSVNEEGDGTAIVTNIGKNTLISQLADQVLKVQQKQSSIQFEVECYVKRVTLFAFFVGTLTFSIGMGNGFHPVIAAMIAIGVIVASAPGVLNLMLRFMLTVSVTRMAQIKLIAKKLYALQSLGNIDCICLDKTGTVTVNKMTVSKMLLNQQILPIKQIQAKKAQNYQEFLQILKCSVLCSIARFDLAPPRKYLNQIYSNKKLTTQKRDQMQEELMRQWQSNLTNKNYSEMSIIGDSTEAAFLRLCQPIMDVENLRQKYPIVKNRQGNDFSLPFNSDRKFSMSLHHYRAQNSAFCVFAKGAPQIIWKMCSHVILNGKIFPKTQAITARCLELFVKLTEHGERSLGFAKYHVPSNHYKDPSQLSIINSLFSNLPLVFMGAISLTDPPREGIEQTILRLKIAGVKVMMLTGDQVSTATNIARECNIIQATKTANQIAIQQNITLNQAMQKSRSVVIGGEQFLSIKYEDSERETYQEKRSLRNILEMDEVVFARTNPAQKLIIVQTLQNMGYSVAVTGDGVNDSPAVRMANCGISMGSASDATMDAASIILSDDNLNNVVKGIQEGRRMYDNLRKSFVYVMTSQISEFVPFLFLISFRIPIPIFTLLIDSAADFLPSIAYAYEEAEEGIMTRKPRDRNQRLVTFKLVAHASGWNGFAGFFACFCCYWICMKDFGFELNYLWGKSNIEIFVPNKYDTYNPTSPFFGNTNLQTINSCASFLANSEGLDWINSARPWADLRMSTLSCTQFTPGVPTFQQNMVFDDCQVQQISMVSMRPVCFTTEATKYAQTSYMFANAINQLFVAIMSKTKKQSVFKHGLRNRGIWVGFGAQYLLGIALAQTWLFTNLIGTRDVLFFHMGLPAIPLGIMQFTVDQIRKYLIRNLPREQKPNQTRKPQECKPNWFQQFTLW